MPSSFVQPCSSCSHALSRFLSCKCTIQYVCALSHTHTPLSFRRSGISVAVALQGMSRGKERPAAGVCAIESARALWQLSLLATAVFVFLCLPVFSLLLPLSLSICPSICVHVRLSSTQARMCANGCLSACKYTHAILQSDVAGFGLIFGDCRRSVCVCRQASPGMLPFA